jgi:alkane 1-monooxygenase
MATLDQHMVFFSQHVPATLRWQDARFLLTVVLLVLTGWAMVSAPEAVGGYSRVFFLAVVFLDAVWPSRWVATPAQADSAYIRFALRTYAVLHVALLALALALVLACQGTWVEALSLAFCTGLIGGTVGQAAAHALGHSPAKSDKFLAWVLMGAMGYPHFMVEHYRGHHPCAATWDDPSSAREGESFWRFLPRSLKGGLQAARALESHRLAQRRLTWLQSPLVWALGAMALVGAVLLVSCSWVGLLYCVVHCLVAICLLEAVNYIEHYGLYRDSLHGFHLPFGKAHAWNASAPVSGTLLFDRPNHSDHHVSPWRPCGTAEAKDAPKLPTGYAGCILLAMVPFVWFAFMHPRLIELQRLADAFESECSSMENAS